MPPQPDWLPDNDLELAKEVWTNMKLSDIVINADLQILLRRLSKDEQDALTESIKRHGVLEPLITWKTDRTLVDGHHRYEVCRELHGEDCEVPCIEMEFDDLNAATEFMLRKQLGRRNLNDAERIYIALQLTELTRTKGKENQRAGGKGLANLPKVNTRAAVAEMAQVSERTVGKAKKVLESTNEVIKSAMLSGKTTIHAAHEAVSPPKSKQKAKAANTPQSACEQSPDYPHNGEPRVDEPTDVNAGTRNTPVVSDNTFSKSMAHADTVVESANVKAAPASGQNSSGTPNEICNASDGMFPGPHLAAIQAPHPTTGAVPVQPADGCSSSAHYKFAPFLPEQFDPSRDTDHDLTPQSPEAAANTMFREVGNRFLSLLDGVKQLMGLVSKSAPKTMTPLEEDERRLCKSIESLGTDLIQLARKWKHRG